MAKIQNPKTHDLEERSFQFEIWILQFGIYLELGACYFYKFQRV